ncbi:MAG: GNAT family N-acetyltransferase [Ignavibacteria bacterium]|nr:GNAT family N-acetyltransferase [Ignavibacteria bacterium]
MNAIVKAGESDAKLLAEIGRQSFIESHGNSASASDINRYVNDTYSEEAIRAELYVKKNLCHILYHGEHCAGYSKIILNASHQNIDKPDVTKLDRLYLLKEFHGRGLGYELLNFNIELSVKNDQSGMWLFVWKENHRAVSFYERTGFRIIGSHDFRISETHTNPNHQMLRTY